MMASSDYTPLELKNVLQPDNKHTRAAFRKLFAQNIPLFKPVYNQILSQQRELAYRRLKTVAQAGIVSINDFAENPMNIFTAHEMLGMIDGSLATKFTVHFNLFGGTMQALSTARHGPVLKGIDKMDYTGCFCLTQLGYGNNAIHMETLAQYNPKTKTFRIHSPSTKSQKYWITNGACHAEYAVVFAQLQLPNKDGKLQGYGVHAFIVRIRDSKRNALPGVFIQDMGIKMGLNGIDNARIWFQNYEAPLQSLLNKYSNVESDGTFKSDIRKLRDRFLYIANRLLSGRICISTMSMGGSKVLTYNTIKYALQRKGVGKDGFSSSPIMEYQLQQNAIIPIVARLLALNMGLSYVKFKFQQLSLKQASSNNPSPPNELVRLCCFIKPLITWHSSRLATVFRERCGGQGYLAVNRVGNGLEFAHAGMTAEGDNSVLMQKVTKQLLGDMRKGEVQLPQMTMCPKNYLIQLMNLDSLDIILNLILWREKYYVEKLMGNMMRKVAEEKKDLFDVWMKEESDLVQNVALAHGQRVIFEYGYNLLNGKVKDPYNIKIGDNLKGVFEYIFRLFGLEIVNKDLALYLVNGVVSSKAAASVEGSIHALVKKMNPHMEKIIESFDVFEQYWTPIAADYVGYNSAPNKGEVTYHLRPKL